MHMSLPAVRPLEPVRISDSEEPGQAQFLLRDGAGLSPNQLVVSLPALYLVELADGTRTVEEVLAEFQRLTGLRLEAGIFRDLLARLDENFLLDNDRAREQLTRLSPRPYRHAGGGYPEEPEALRQFLANLLRSPQGEPPAHPVRASILPHIDFFRGEEAYRAGYHPLKRPLGEAEQPLTVVVLGISHAASRTPFILTRKDFATPLGVVETDTDLVEKLAQGLDFDPFRDEYNHLAEHSIEFHAVVLRYLREERPLRIVPVLCSSFFPAIRGKFSPLELPGVSSFLENLRRLQQNRPDVHFLASVDLAHMGTQFDGPPLDRIQLEELRNQDRATLQAVELGDSEAFFATHQADGGRRNYCGTPAIYTLLELFPEPFSLHSYVQCNTPDLSSTVTVASMTLRTASAESADHR